MIFHKKYFILFTIFIFLVPLSSYGAGINIDLGSSNLSSKILEFVLLISILSLAPSLLIMLTSFTRIVIILSFLRNAIGLQQTPPNPVLISLALFLTLFIMTPTFEGVYNDGVAPYLEEKIDDRQAWKNSSEHIKKFMLKFTRDKDLELFATAAKLPASTQIHDLPINIIIPAFMISELRRAFEIGFLIFLPFLIIDMLVASVLMAMGMMMLPPTTIALPFKLIFFVAIDGWYMICGSLIKSFLN